MTEMVEESAKRSETSPIRRMFSTREAWSKPRSLITEMCLSASHPSIIVFLGGGGTHLVETESDVITVQPIRMELFMEQVLFKCCRDGRLFFFF